MKRTIQNLKQKLPKELVTIKEVTEILKVTRQSVYHYRLADLLKPVKSEGGRILFKHEDVLKFKDQLNKQKALS